MVRVQGWGSWGREFESHYPDYYVYLDHEFYQISINEVFTWVYYFLINDLNEYCRCSLMMNYLWFEIVWSYYKKSEEMNRIV